MPSIFIGVQIETAGALASLEEIAAIPDIDLLFVGPSDLSQVLGVTGDFENPEVPGGDRDHRPRVCRRQEALGHLQSRARIRGANAELGMPVIRSRRRHSCRARRHSLGQGALRSVLHSGLSVTVSSMPRRENRPRLEHANSPESSKAGSPSG